MKTLSIISANILVIYIIMYIFNNTGTDILDKCK